MGIPSSKDRIIVTVEKDLKEQLKVLAEKDGRNLSNFVAKLLKDYIENNQE